MASQIVSRHVVLSGCSGGGKSTLLAELARRNHRTVCEPGRRIVAEELRGEGKALPWIDPAAFARRAIAVAAEDRRLAAEDGAWTFFDRGLIDAAVALHHATGTPIATTLAPFPRYHPRVFLAPPWPELYATDHERRHDWDEAVAEYDRLVIACRALDYDAIILPKDAISKRADFILDRLGA